MKFRRTPKFHGLKRPRIRQSWNKNNLFNLHHFRLPPLVMRSFFQQKWTAKAMTRAYHGEHIKEHHWERMFSRNMASVVDMDPRYMAQFDGAEQAEGRGSGRQRDPNEPLPPLKPWAGTNLKTTVPTPFMQMAYAPLERRLDVAVFRAMFASSTRQARQFIIHGAVRVNGKKMVHPSYMLNPGDMYQVDVERVLFATGAKKPTPRAEIRAQRNRDAEKAKAAREAGESAEAEAEAAEAAEAADAGEATESINAKATRELPYLAARAKYILNRSGEGLTVKRKKALRQFVKDARKWIVKAAPAVEDAAPPPSSAILDRLADLLANSHINDVAPVRTEIGKAGEAGEAAKSDKSEEQDTTGKPARKKAVAKKEVNHNLSEEERRRFQQLIARDAENPFDPSKPYATPWRPRPFMNAFALIPRYLEVNHRICSAIYVRHPVARPSMAEVPTPFPFEINQLAFNYYLRRH